MDSILPILVISGIVLVALIVIGLIMARMYRRATKELAFVRTGFGGQKVILNGGGLVLPVLHDIIWVSLNTLKLVITRRNEDAMITKDRMRVDVVAEFYLRVKTDKDAIAFAAQTLGDRTLNPEKLKELMEGKFVDALRSVAAEMALTELHEKRSDFVQKVQNAVSEDLTKNGLELETVSLTGLDQTDIKFFNDQNVFDAEGMTRLTDTIESRKKLRNDIEQENRVAIEKKNLEAEQQSLNIAKEKEYATLAQQREIQTQTAKQQAAIKKEQADQQREADEAKIAADRSVEMRRIESERDVESETLKKEQTVRQLEIQKEKAVEIENQERDIAVAKKSEEQSKAKADAELARAEAVKAQEKVTTAQATEVAERQKNIAVIKAKESAESDAAKVIVSAEAEKTAAVNKAQAIKTQAQAEADAVKIKADADERRYAVEAEGKEALNEAENKLSPEIIGMRVQLEMVSQVAAIVEASVKPIEKIDGIKVINVAGLGTNGTASGNGASGGQQGFTDNLMNSILSYRAQAPIVDGILQSMGLGKNLESVVKTATDMATKAPTTAPGTPEASQKAAPAAPESPTA